MINSFTTSTYKVTLTSVSTYESTALSYKAGITASTSSVYESTSSYKSFSIVSTESGVAEANVSKSTSDVSRGDYTIITTKGVPNNNPGLDAYTNMPPLETGTSLYIDKSEYGQFELTATFTSTCCNTAPLISNSDIKLSAEVLDGNWLTRDILDIDNNYESGVLKHEFNSSVTIRFISRSDFSAGAMTFPGIKQTTGEATSYSNIDYDTDNDLCTYWNAVWKSEKQTLNSSTNKLVTKTFLPKVTGRQESLIAETNRVTEYLNDLYYSSTGTTMRSTISSLSTETTFGSTVVSSDTLVYSESHIATTTITDLYTKKSVVRVSTAPASYSTRIILDDDPSDEEAVYSASTTFISSINSISVPAEAQPVHGVISYSRVTTKNWPIYITNGSTAYGSLDQWLFKIIDNDSAYFSVNMNATMHNSNDVPIAESDMLDLNLITGYSKFEQESSIWQSLIIVTT